MTKEDISSQLESFKQAARELGCDESEEAFRHNLRSVAKAPVAKKAVKAK